jgi:hypothetical protein
MFAWQRRTLDARGLDQPHADLRDGRRRCSASVGIGSMHPACARREYNKPDAWPGYLRGAFLAFLGFFGFFSTGSFSDPDLAKAEAA